MPGSQITVSVIVTARNAQRTLPRCLQALQNQELPGMEVIVVDCGSTDRTHEIALEFQRAEPDVFRVHRQKNGDPGEARSAGLALARGKYAAFRGAREIAPPGMYRTLYEACEETGADVLGRIWDPALRNTLARRAFLLAHGLPVKTGCDRDEQLAAFDTLRKLVRPAELPLFCAGWIAALRGVCLQIYRESGTGASFYESMISLAGEPQVAQAVALADRRALGGAHRRFLEAFAARKWIGLERKMRWQLFKTPVLARFFAPKQGFLEISLK